MEIEGRLVEVLAEQSGQGRTGNTWRKQSFVIETMDSQYPKKVCIDVWGDNIDNLKAFKTNDVLNVKMDIESREYNGRWFTNVKAWRVDKKQDAAGGSAPQGGGMEQPPLPGAADIPSAPEPTDDLPF